MKTMVVGASSGLGRELATELARRKHDLVLVASGRRDLEALAADLTLRHGVAVELVALDLATAADPGARLLAALDAESALDALLLPLGMSRGHDDFSLDAAAIGELLAINLHAPLAIIHALLPRLLAAQGVIVLFGSVAAVRGRGRNVVYAAAKRALVSVYESLRQRFAPGQLRVQLYEPGFIATNLTWGMRLPMPASDPARLARQIVAGLGRGSRRRFVPARYALIAALLRGLPWALYRRMRA
ncbi:MAG: SDR family NAD(P)-dependent oxidoreductase [Xanthomonadales bacterium]|nr:SDR family NAD(P)-dependent oxidoreductase [Xanthomonadales bacterium]